MASNEAIDYYRWEVRGENNCPRCEAMAGTVRTLAEWRMSIQPGFHAGCDCILVYDSSVEGEELNNDFYGWLADLYERLDKLRAQLLEGFGGIVAATSKGLAPRIETPQAKLPAGGYVSGWNTIVNQAVVPGAPKIKQGLNSSFWWIERTTKKK